MNCPTCKAKLEHCYGGENPIPDIEWDECPVCGYIGHFHIPTYPKRE